MVTAHCLTKNLCFSPFSKLFPPSWFLSVQCDAAKTPLQRLLRKVSRSLGESHRSHSSSQAVDITPSSIPLAPSQDEGVEASDEDIDAECKLLSIVGIYRGGGESCEVLKALDVAFFEGLTQ